MTEANSEGVDPWRLTDVVTRLRRVLRVSIRSEHPWETLPMAQVELLQRLAEQPGTGVRDLAAQHRLAANTVSTLVQQLVTAGLVSREPDPLDRRAVVLALTTDGERALADWTRAHERRFREALAALGAEDRARIAGALPALAALVEALEGDAAERRSR